MRSAAPIPFTVLPPDNFEHRFKTPIEYRLNFFKHATKQYEWKSNSYKMRERMVQNAFAEQAYNVLFPVRRETVDAEVVVETQE